MAAKASKVSVILAMLPETGERYLSTVLFEALNTGSGLIQTGPPGPAAREPPLSAGPGEAESHLPPGASSAES